MINTLLPHPDSYYERKRNLLIPKAVAKANRNFGSKCNAKDEKARERWTADWNKSFHSEMNRLAKVWIYEKKTRRPILKNPVEGPDA
jgi:hypothetical protein